MSFLAALQFLTIAPPLVRRHFTPRELGRAVGYFPLVGLLVGAILLGLDELSRLAWPPSICAALGLTAWVLITGALHLDGFLDSCDGMLGGHTPEKRLTIMKDERVGAFAVVGGILLLLLKYQGLAALPERVAGYLLAPVLGRWAMVVAILFFPYARTDGLGRALKDNAGWWQGLLATAIAAAACWWAAQGWGLAAMALAAGTTLVAVRFALARLPGLTGDLYGAICEGVEVVVLLFFAARVPT